LKTSAYGDDLKSAGRTEDVYSVLWKLFCLFGKDYLHQRELLRHLKYGHLCLRSVVPCSAVKGMPLAQRHTGRPV